MELLNNPQIHSTFASLGSSQGDKYVINEDCISILEEINCKLSMEDHTLRTYRRAIGFGQNVKKDLMPLLINAKDPKILDSAIRLLVNLTVPIECLLSVGVMSRTEIGRHTIYELNRLLYTSKEAFVDLKVTKAIIDHMKNILESDHKLSISQCETINNCLLLLRNILHIPENVQQHTQMQNQILWNLFTQSIDKLLIHLMSCGQRSFWGVTIVQLIALMYKDQHVGTLQKLLNHWFEAASYTESSEDNESNTSPPKKSSGDSSPMLTSDPTSDSSDNGSGKMTSISNPSVDMSVEYQNQIMRVKPKAQNTQQDSVDSGTGSSEIYSDDILMKSPEPSSSSSSSTNGNHKQQHSNKKSNKKQNSSPEASDCGYGTQVSQGDIQGDKNQENISVSSSDDDFPKQKPAHQKPPSTNQKQRFNAVQKQRNATVTANTPATSQEKNDARRKKLVKRSKSSIINMKGMIQHTPTDEDISNILKEFTVDFLLKGYGYLVQDLHGKLMTDLNLSIDTSHFFWLVTYFLKFAAQLELDLEHISSVLSFEIVSFLTFEGANLCEQLELTSRQQGTDLKPYLRRIHLVVTAIREFLQALEVYKKSSHLSNEDRERIVTLQTQIGCTEDLRHLFVLLMRCYKPQLQSRQYLQDLVVTNHILLLLLENVSKQSLPKCSIKFNDHVQQFATVDIMHHYGVLLENFTENGDFVNDCIFTMIHHVAGDLSQVTILFQPNILKSFSKIWEAEYDICDDWSDLIEYVIHKFINTPSKPLIALPTPMCESISIIDIWAQEEIDTLYWYYVQNKQNKDIVGAIINLMKESGHQLKSRMAVIQQLLQQDIISLVEYDDLMKYEDSQYEREAKTYGYGDSPKEESGIEVSENSEVSMNSQSDDIKLLRDRLLKENKGKLLLWLQQVLIECCFVKLTLTREEKGEKRLPLPVMEPIPFHCILNKMSIPLVPFNTEQNKILVYQPFVLLLHKLGFHLPADANKLYVRIPEFWTTDILFKIAEKLGPIRKQNLKFDINCIKNADDDHMDFTNDIVPHLSPPLLHSSAFFAGQPFDITNPPNRCTTEVTPSDRNWLQVVMQSKSSASESGIEQCSPKSNVTLDSPKPHQFLYLPAISIVPARIAEITSNDLVLIAKPKDDIQEQTINDENEAFDCFDTNSAASSLHRMYVSDEEDKHDPDLISDF